MEAKYRSDVSERTTHDETRNQVIRLIDIGAWYARQGNPRDRDTGHYNSYVAVLQYGDAQINAEEVVDRYTGKPEAIEKAFALSVGPYSHRLSALESDTSLGSSAVFLAASIKWVTASATNVPEPQAGSRTRWSRGSVTTSRTIARANQSGV